MPDIAEQMRDADRSRLAPQIDPNAGKDKDPNPSAEHADDAKFLDVRVLRTQYLDYLSSKTDEIEEQKNSRRYYHGAQYTAEQLKVLQRRRQPPQTWNRVNRKINGIVGLVERLRSDPKALPRNLRSEQGANVVTQSVRYVMDSNDWKGIEPWCLLQACIDGVSGVKMFLTKGDQGDPDIDLPWVIGDEYFYDPKSYRLDFSDARYEGESKWMDLDEAIDLFPGKEETLRSLCQGDADLTTNADREVKWVISASKRIRLVEHWYKHRGEWCWAFYVSNVLLDQGVSPFKDEKGKTISPYLMFSVAVDQDGDRYGFVRNLRPIQDALNQSKSKALHISNSRRLIMDKGAVDDVERTRIEWARPDGVIEKNPGSQIAPDNTAPDLQAQIAFSEDAKGEIDQFANINLAIMSGSAINNISGRAIEMLRQPGMAELGPFILAIRQWKLKVARRICNAVQQHWTAQRWIRVSDNEGLAKFLQINGLDVDQFGRPTIVNALGQIDVDIIIEEGPDVASLMRDTYDVLRSYPPGTFPPQVLIEMSDLPRSEKNRILQMMQPKPNPVAQIATKLQLEGAAAKNAKTAAEAKLSGAKVDQALATAQATRAKIGTEAARAGHLATQSHLDAAEFARDTMIEAHNVSKELTQIYQPQQPQQPQQAQPPQGQQQ